jgi:hypothetical protein
MFSHYQKAILPELGEHARDLCVREVLQHLAQEDYVSDRERLIDDVEAHEFHILTSEHRGVVANELGHNVTGDIPTAEASQLAADMEVTASEIHDIG